MTGSLRHRAGVSLLEAIVALAILGGALAALSQILGTGVDAGREATALVQCRMVCSRQLAGTLLEADTGITPVTSLGQIVSGFETDVSQTYVCDTEVTQAPMAGLTQVRIRVRAVDPKTEMPLAEYSLVRWIVDPITQMQMQENEALVADASAEGTSDP